MILAKCDFSVSNDDLSICLYIANQILIPCRCADYVKHLMELTESKEAAVEKAKSELEEKKEERMERRKKKKAEEGDKPAGDATAVDLKAKDDAVAVMQESDNESETSSLTAFSSGEGAEDGNEGSARRSKRTRATGTSSPSDDVDADGGKKIKSNDKRKHGSKSVPPASQKKVRLTPSGNKSSSAAGDSFFSDESGPGGRNISLDKMSSSVSEMTDSNQSSSMAEIDTGAHDADRPTSSISSTAAVGPPRGESREKKHHHADVVIKEKKSERKGRKRKIAEAKEKTSLDKDFELDYSEVFHTANVPQLIATPAGKVVTWNDFFLRATGLSGEEAKRLSIFSIVQADKLSTLFELVANALKNGATKKKRKRKRSRQSGAHRDESNPSSVGSSVNKTLDGNSVAGSAAASATTSRTGSETSTASSNKAVDYSAVTLPCVPFQATYPKVHVPTEKNQSPDPKGAEAGDDAAKDKSSDDEKVKADADLSIPLYMTVTLMSDDDPRKRCFHCVLTDTPSTSTGKIGTITPELLAMLFTVDDEEDHDEDEGGFCFSLTNTASNSKANNGTTTLESSTKSSSAAETTSEADGKVESQKKPIAT